MLTDLEGENLLQFETMNLKGYNSLKKWFWFSNLSIFSFCGYRKKKQFSCETQESSVLFSGVFLRIENLNISSHLSIANIVSSCNNVENNRSLMRRYQNNEMKLLLYDLLRESKETTTLHSNVIIAIWEISAEFE